MDRRACISILGVVLVCLAGVACSRARPSSPGPVSSTAPPLSPANPGDHPSDTAVRAGMAVSFSGTRLTIPDGLATGAKPESVAAMDNEPVPVWEKAPEFIQFTLEHYAVQAALLQPTVAVYPAAKYAQDNNGAAQSLQRLRSLISAPGGPLNTQTVPFVPSFNATQTFIAQAGLLKFRNGAGVRMVTQYDQAFVPVNNHELIYHFEGLTDDGRYYVIVVLPINSAKLPADGRIDSSVPAGGVPFDTNNPQAYFAAITARLNAASLDDFSPPIASLDALVGSIDITAP